MLNPAQTERFKQTLEKCAGRFTARLPKPDIQIPPITTGQGRTSTHIEPALGMPKNVPNPQGGTGAMPFPDKTISVTPQPRPAPPANRGPQRLPGNSKHPSEPSDALQAIQKQPTPAAPAAPRGADSEYAPHDAGAIAPKAGVPPHLESAPFGAPIPSSLVAGRAAHAEKGRLQTEKMPAQDPVTNRVSATQNTDRLMRNDQGTPGDVAAFHQLRGEIASPSKAPLQPLKPVTPVTPVTPATPADPTLKSPVRNFAEGAWEKTKGMGRAIRDNPWKSTAAGLGTATTGVGMTRAFNPLDGIGATVSDGVPAGWDASFGEPAPQDWSTRIEEFVKGFGKPLEEWGGGQTLAAGSALMVLMALLLRGD